MVLNCRKCKCKSLYPLCFLNRNCTIHPPSFIIYSPAWMNTIGTSQTHAQRQCIWSVLPGPGGPGNPFGNDLFGHYLPTGDFMHLTLITSCRNLERNNSTFNSINHFALHHFGSQGSITHLEATAICLHCLGVELNDMGEQCYSSYSELTALDNDHRKLSHVAIGFKLYDLPTIGKILLLRHLGSPHFLFSCFQQMY